MTSVGPVDWSKFGAAAAAAAGGAADKTNQELAGELHTLTRLTAAEVESLAPTLSDKAKLAELMTIVKSAESHNQKITRIVDNAERFGEVVLRLGQLVAKVAVL